jgi:serine/threonine-protein kinase RsbW
MTPGIASPRFEKVTSGKRNTQPVCCSRASGAHCDVIVADEHRDRQMKMSILERDDEVTHVVLSGRLDTTGTDEVREIFQTATGARERPTIVDLSGVDFLASVGIGLLVANVKRLMRAGHRMVLVNPRELVESVLRTSRLENLLPIARDLDEAIGILRGTQEPIDRPTPLPKTTEDGPRRQRSERAVAEASVSPREFRVSIENKLSELKGLNSNLAPYLDAHGVTDRAAYAVNLAIDELVSNVIRYAYVDDDTHLIDITLAIDREQVILRIEDDGRPFDPRRGPALDLHAEDREVGGLGLLLVLDMVDALKYRRVKERNCVEVRVHLTTEVNVDDLLPGE